MAMEICSSVKNYALSMENDWEFWTCLKEDTHAFFIVDDLVYRLYRDALFQDLPKDRLFLLTAVEENKTIEKALEICEALTELQEKRNIHLVSVGGGIIQDVTGFAANVLYRGIKWTFIPTTLLAACDSCIGGKTSLNYKRFKNLLGTFYPPNRLHIHPAFFQTLSDCDFESGLGEVVKFNIMAGQDGLCHIEDGISKLLKRDERQLSQYVLNSLEFKKRFIEEDEFDRGERIKLNFGHTFGHAIETVTQYEIPHGTAVAIGMIMANSVSVERGLLSADTARRSERVLLRVIHIEARLGDIPLEQFTDAMHKDKKQTDGLLTVVLMADDGLHIMKDIQEAEVRRAVSFFQELYDNQNGERGS